MKKLLVFITSISALAAFTSCAPKVVDFYLKDPKTRYIVHSDFVAPNVTVTFSNGEKKDVSNEVTFSGFNMDKVGNYTVNVAYLKYSTTYNISVKQLLYEISDNLIIEDEECNKVKNKYTYKEFNKYNAYDLSACPSIGDPKILVIPVWFTDSDTYIPLDKRENVRSDIETTFFGSLTDTGWNSVKTYYEQDSFNRCHLDGVVAPWFEYDKASTNLYGNGGDGGINATTRVVNRAYRWYKELSGSDMTEFDTDNDGYLDGVIIVYGAPDYLASGEEAPNLWAYCYWLQNHNYKDKTNPGPNVFMWASYDFMYDDNNAYDRSGNYYANGDCQYCNIDAHTYIHEMGHIFGLDDYYDYSYEGYQFAGGFSMQDLNIAAHDPFSRYALGWCDPFVPTQTTTFDVDPIEGVGDVILLASDFTGSPFAEYILLELFTPDGLNEADCTHSYDYRPQGPNSAGVRIWHIDARLASFKSSYEYVITDNPKNGNVILANSNSSGDRSKGYAGSTDYKLLQLIRNNKYTSWQAYDVLTKEDLFTTGDIFSISDYYKQFPNGNYLNSGDPFPWTVTFDEVTPYGMTITCTLNNN